MSFLAALQSSDWAYSALGVAHICGVAMLLGNLLILEMRVFGRGATLDAGALASLSLGIAAVGFCLAAVSGLLMFSLQAAELLANRTFTLKMLLLMLAGCNAAWFHGRSSLSKLDGMAKAQMVVSTLIWLAVVICGRLVADV